jgi:hypothetical protein
MAKPKVQTESIRGDARLSAQIEITRFGQTFYREKADRLFPEGCTCPDDSGACNWCQVYYCGE